MDETDWDAVNAETRRVMGVRVRELTPDDPMHPLYVKPMANAEVANSPQPDMANSGPTYRHRNADSRRAYMRDYMRKRRQITK